MVYELYLNEKLEKRVKPYYLVLFKNEQFCITLIQRF